MLVDEYWVDRDRWLRAPAGFVGVHNLSNTCYLNSLLTQLFMNQPFRNFTLQLPFGPEDQAGRSSYCLKALFSRMQASFSRAIEPRDLVESLRDFAGQPIDPHIQMDVDEFFNLLFDRIESEMPSSELKTAFRSYYGGHLVQQVKSNECAHISELTEAFSAIQCDIKGKHNLQESLKAYVEGEIMEGDNKYRCTTCDRLVDAVKRTCLKDTPDHLIFHLKRFDFDLATMNRSKINDRFEFPTKLDMKPYTIDHLSSLESGTDQSSEADEFELVGVLVHTGTAESGHYYSYIRNRLSPAEHPSWLEFNDSEVSPFDPMTIPDNCYGGNDGISATGYLLPKAFSAYMLFYQRSATLPRSGNGTPLLPPGQLLEEPSCIPHDIRMEITKENEELMRRYCMYSGDYVAFVRELVDARFRVPPAQQQQSMEDGPMDLEVLNLAMRIYEQVCARVKDFPGWESLAASLEAFACRTEECARAFLEWASESAIIHSIILDNPFMAVRSCSIKLILSVLGHMKRTNGVLYGLPYGGGGNDDDEDEDEDGVRSLGPREHTMLDIICRGYSESWLTLQQGIKPWNDYFGFLAELSSWGDCERDYLLKYGMLSKILHIILVDQLGPAKRMEMQIENFVKIMNKPRVPVTRLAELLCQLMGRCSPFVRPCKTEAGRHRRNVDAHSPLPLTVHEQNFLTVGQSVLIVFNKLLDWNGTHSAVGRMITGILTVPGAPIQDELLDDIKNTLLNGISVDPAVHATPYLQCLVSFVVATKSQKYVTEIIAKVSDEIPTIGATGGMEHLHFFQRLWPLDSPNKNIKTPMMQYIGRWAPALLVYHESNVREAADNFIQQMIFEGRSPPDADADGDAATDAAIFGQAVLDLANGLYQFITTKLPQNNQALDESTFSPAWRILMLCRDFALGEALFADKFEGKL